MTKKNGEFDTADAHWSKAGRTPGIGENRRGWMMFAYSGALQLERLTPDQIDIGDIAHGLGNIMRFNGQTKTPISVLWHSLMVEALCRQEPRAIRLEALFHDAGEVYVGDWIRPIHALMGTELHELRTRTQAACFKAAGLPSSGDQSSTAVKTADNLMVRYEMLSAWGYGRMCTWYEKPTRQEHMRAEYAQDAIGPPTLSEKGRKRLLNRFVELADELVEHDAPIRESVTRQIKDDQQPSDRELEGCRTEQSRIERGSRMQTKTGTGESTGTVAGPKGNPNHLTFHDTTDTKRIMRAVRKILLRGVERNETRWAARVFSRAGRTGVQIIVTDGCRLALIDMDPEPNVGAERVIDFVMPVSAVSHIINETNSGPIRIEDAAGACRVSAGTGNGEWKLFPKAKIYPLGILDRILNEADEGIGPLIEKIPRTAVQNWIRGAKGAQEHFEGDLCRIELRRGGVKVWGTTSPKVDEADNPGRLLKADVSRCPEPMLLAMNRQELLQTLQTMRSKHVNVHVRRPDRAVGINGIERREQFLLMPRPLR